MIRHLITDRWRLAGRTRAWSVQRQCLLRQVTFAADAGIDVVQLRERDLDAALLFDLASASVAAVRGSSTRIVVNDRLDVALAAGAHGVHLRGDSLAPAVVRRLAPPGFLVGRSVHSVDDAVRAGTDVDYLVAGTIWATPSKPADHRLLGVDGLAQIVAAVHMPVLAIGGVTPERLAAVGQAGAHGFAAIGLFIRDAGSTDTMEECGAVPLHDVVRQTALRPGGAGLPTT